MQVITNDLLTRLSEEACTSPRLRKNFNLHSANESSCHRLLNAIDPASYIRPHRHLDPEKDEAFILMNGRLGIIEFSDEGEVVECVILSHDDGILAVDVPSGVFHTAVSLEPGTVFFEAKAGPYLPLSDAEIAAWAPPDGDDGVPRYLEYLKKQLLF